MTSKEFQEVMKERGMVSFEEDLIFFDRHDITSMTSIELFDKKAKISYYFDDYDEVMKFKLSNGKTIEEFLKPIKRFVLMLDYEGIEYYEN